MADRGFNISGLLDDKGVKLNIPPSLSDSSGQLSESDRVKTHRIASLRVHIERAIERVKNYRILESVPNSMHNIANQIFFVSAMLTNFHPTLVGHSLHYTNFHPTHPTLPYTLFAMLTNLPLMFCADM